MYKSFLRPHPDYDRAFNVSFKNKLESVQYNAALAIAGAIRGSLRERFYQELGLESIKYGGGIKNCVCFSNLKKKHSSHLFEMILKVLSIQTTKNRSKIPLFNAKHEYI